MTDITIRHATLEDKDDVMRIHENVYEGSDYLPEYYDEFMACSNTTSYIAIINNKIVSSFDNGSYLNNVHQSATTLMTFN